MFLSRLLARLRLAAPREPALELLANLARVDIAGRLERARDLQSIEPGLCAVFGLSTPNPR